MSRDWIEASHSWGDLFRSLIAGVNISRERFNVALMILIICSLTDDEDKLTGVGGAALLAAVKLKCQFCNHFPLGFMVRTIVSFAAAHI